MQGLLAFILYAQLIINQGQASTSLIRDYIAAVATLDGVDVQTALIIAKDESGFNPQAIGDHGTSIGLFQIHLPAHPDISEKQAEDPIFSTEWTMQKLKEGECDIWSTCPNNGS